MEPPRASARRCTATAPAVVARFDCSHAQGAVKASMRKVDSYVEKLYDEALVDKLKGARWLVSSLHLLPLATKFFFVFFF